MKSKPTPWTHTGITTAEISTQCGPGRVKHDVTVPKGTLCVKLEGGNTPWVVQDLKFIPRENSFLYHDADHYGIVIPEDKIADILPAGTPRPVAQTIYYGSITAPLDAESKLRRAGVEVGDYNFTQGSFHVRATPEARALLSELEAEFKIDLHARQEKGGGYWLRDIKTIPDDELMAERAYHQFWIHSPRNDGRLTAGSSAELDLRFEQVQAIDQRLNEISAPSIEANAAKPDAATPAPDDNTPSI